MDLDSKREIKNFKGFECSVVVTYIHARRKYLENNCESNINNKIDLLNLNETFMEYIGHVSWCKFNDYDSNEDRPFIKKYSIKDKEKIELVNIKKLDWSCWE